MNAQAVEMVKESRGIAQTHELAAEHAQKAVHAIDSLPPNPSLQVQQCHRALIDRLKVIISSSKEY
jgi:geranyl diphosphate synthase